MDEIYVLIPTMEIACQLKVGIPPLTLQPVLLVAAKGVSAQRTAIPVMTRNAKIVQILDSVRVHSALISLVS